MSASLSLSLSLRGDALQIKQAPPGPAPFSRRAGKTQYSSSAGLSTRSVTSSIKDKMTTIF